MHKEYNLEMDQKRLLTLHTGSYYILFLFDLNLYLVQIFVRAVICLMVNTTVTCGKNLRKNVGCLINIILSFIFVKAN